MLNLGWVKFSNGLSSFCNVIFEVSLADRSNSKFITKKKQLFLIYRAFSHRENPTFKIWQRMRFVVVFRSYGN